MVMELTPERAADFQTACAYERVFGSEILALLRVYGLDDGRVCFYLEEQEGALRRPSPCRTGRSGCPPTPGPEWMG